MKQAKHTFSAAWLSNIHPLWGVIPLCIYGLWERFIWRYHNQLWADEIWQIRNINRGFLDMIRMLPQQEFCSYLSGDNFLTYPFVRIFGPDNRWLIAIPHIIMVFVGFFLLYKICQMMFRTPVGFWVAFAVMAVNNTLAKHAFEIRTYAVLPVLALAVFYSIGLMVRHYTVWKRRQWIAMSVFTVLAIWFHAYGIAMVFFCTVFWLGWRRKEADFLALFKRVVIFFIPVLIVAMPLWVISVFGPHYEHGFRPIFQFIPHPFYYPIGFIKGIVGNLIGFEGFYILYPVMALSMLLPHKDRYAQMAMLLLLIALPITLILMSDISKQYWFVQRQFIWCMAYMAVLMGWCADTCVRWFGRDPLLRKE